MFHFILARVIGGDSGKREVALFVLTLWLVLSLHVLRREVTGGTTEVALSMWYTLTPFAFGTLVAAFGFEGVTQWFAATRGGK